MLFRPALGQLTIRKTRLLPQGGVPLSPDPRPVAGPSRAFASFQCERLTPPGHVTDTDGAGKQNVSPMRGAARASGFNRPRFDTALATLFAGC
jgi:hypothetical protein